MTRPRVLVTRAAETADELCDALLSRGCEPVRLPLMEFAAGPDVGAVTETIASSPSESVVITTSPRGAEALTTAGGPQGRRVVSVGEGLPNADAVADVVIDAPPPQCLWLTGDRALPTLRQRLGAASIPLLELVVYRTILRRPPDEERDEALADLAGAAFTSPSAVEALVSSAPAAWLDRARPALACGAIGDTTGAALRRTGFQVVHVASSPTMASLADAASIGCGL